VIEQTLPPKGEYVDRRRTLPKRLVPLSLHLTRLQPGQHVLIVEICNDGAVKFKVVAALLDRLLNL
jgi:hypothetical protein